MTVAIPLLPLLLVLCTVAVVAVVVVVWVGLGHEQQWVGCGLEATDYCV